MRKNPVPKQQSTYWLTETARSLLEAEAKRRGGAKGHSGYGEKSAIVEELILVCLGKGTIEQVMPLLVYLVKSLKSDSVDIEDVLEALEWRLKEGKQL